MKNDLKKKKNCLNLQKEKIKNLLRNLVHINYICF